MIYSRPPSCYANRATRGSRAANLALQEILRYRPVICLATRPQVIPTEQHRLPVGYLCTPRNCQVSVGTVFSHTTSCYANRAIRGCRPANSCTARNCQVSVGGMFSRPFFVNANRAKEVAGRLSLALRIMFSQPLPLTFTLLYTRRNEILYLMFSMCALRVL